MISLFFKKKEPSLAEAAEARKYFEVWADSLENVGILKKICLSLIFMNLFLTVLLSRSLRKPPLVIRVDEVGRAEPIRAVNAGAGVSRPEVLNFVQLFMKYFMERNFYTWDENRREAEKMMTAQFREIPGAKAEQNQESSLVKENKLTSKMNFSDIEVTRETKDLLLISLKGWRQIGSYSDPNYLKETIFQSELVLKKTPRSLDAPYGLLVDSYKENVFKND